MNSTIVTNEEAAKRLREIDEWLRRAYPYLSHVASPEAVRAYIAHEKHDGRYEPTREQIDSKRREMDAQLALTSPDDRGPHVSKRDAIVALKLDHFVQHCEIRGEYSDQAKYAEQHQIADRSGSTFRGYDPVPSRYVLIPAERELPPTSPKVALAKNLDEPHKELNGDVPWTSNLGIAAHVPFMCKYNMRVNGDGSTTHSMGGYDKISDFGKSIKMAYDELSVADGIRLAKSKWGNELEIVTQNAGKRDLILAECVRQGVVPQAELMERYSEIRAELAREEAQRVRDIALDREAPVVEPERAPDPPVPETWPRHDGSIHASDEQVDARVNELLEDTPELHDVAYYEPDHTDAAERIAENAERVAANEFEATGNADGYEREPEDHEMEMEL
jgi:hypothetical protein